MEAVIGWAQGLPATAKLIASVGIVILAVTLTLFALYILWQPPPASVEGKSPLPPSQSFSVASSGQSGGVTANQYIVNTAPPATDQEKQKALSNIQSEIAELIAFPNRPDIPEPRTLLESIASSKAPHQLYVILSKYYQETVKSVPVIGAALYEYKQNYYGFETKEFDFEGDTTTQIGKFVTVRFRSGWSIYFRYFLLRSAGFTQQQIVDGGSFLNYGITWEDAERVFEEITKKPDIGPVMAEQLRHLNDMLAAANEIFRAYPSR